MDMKQIGVMKAIEEEMEQLTDKASSESGDNPFVRVLNDFKKRNAEYLEVAQETQRLLAEFNEFSILVRNRHQTIKEYAIRKLAQTLYDCVECEEPRQDTDWLTAEHFINDNFHTETLDELGQRDLVLRAYNIFIIEEKREQREVSPLSNNIIHCFWEGFNDYSQILRCLIELPETRRIRIFQEACNSNDDIDLYLGRIIWNRCYQRIKHQLPRPPYGRIWMH